MMKIHITKQGESIDTIANTYAVSRQDLTGINPHINLASDLVPGLKLKIPDANRTEKNEHIEKFFPNLEHEKHLEEKAIPIGLKPFESSHLSGHHHSTMPNHHTPPEATHPTHPPHPTSHSSTPWSHLGEHTTPFNPEVTQHYPWNQPFPPFSTADTRAILPPPPLPYYPPYGYPYPYAYPYGYGLPLPIPGFGPGYGFGHGFGHGFHGGGHFGGGHHR